MVNMASGRVREWNCSTLSLLGHYLHVRMYSTHTPPSTSTHMHTVWGLNNFRITHIHTKTHRHINWSVICYLWEQMWRFSWWQFKGWSDLTTFYCHRCVCVCVCVSASESRLIKTWWVSSSMTSAPLTHLHLTSPVWVCVGWWGGFTPPITPFRGSEQVRRNSCQSLRSVETSAVLRWESSRPRG